VRALHLINMAVAPAGLFLPPLRDRGFEIDDVDAQADVLPESLAGYDAVISCGGDVNTHQIDELPWMRAELGLLQEALETGVPVMGLCLGAQLLTLATGGSVYRSQTEIGWVDVEMDAAAASDPVLGGVPRRFTALEWHDYACTPGSETQTLGRNDVCVQAFRAGEAAWGTQFHVEVSHELILGWWAEGEEQLIAAGYGRDRFMREMQEHHGRHAAIGTDIAERFAEVAVSRAATRRPRQSSRS
jgi:GMP synthase (glutamine-hydrolysing)